MSYLCGCYYYVTSIDYYARMTKHYLPLLDSEAHSVILSTTSRTVLKQTFWNCSSEEAIKECVYTFPLYDGVSVVSFTCRIGSRVLRGLVKENVKAKEIFDQAVARGETAGLLEQAPEASDVFSTKLGNIPAGKSVIVEITYIGELKHHETDGIRFTIPTSIAPRYGDGPYTTVVHGNLPVQDNGGIKITVDVNMPTGSFIKAVQSPSHPIAVSMGTLSTAAEADPSMSKASATLSLGRSALEEDFVLIVHSKDIGTPKAILETHPTIPNHRALMATLVPKFVLPPSRPEIVFVADRSGSMIGNISMLISAMKVFLKSMRVGVKFNICSFGSSYSFLWPQSKSYTSETLQQATTHVEKFDACMGGTETFRAIKATIEQRFTDLPLEIMLLTDGDIWQQGNLFAYINEQVEKTDGKIRVFPLGIGNGVSHSLIEGLARAGNGYAQSVQDGERLDNCVVRMLRGALSPHITDYTIEVKYEKDDDDFEVIEKVTEGMKVLLSDSEVPVSTQTKPEQPLISLFDPNADPEKEDIEMQDAEPELPKIRHPKILQAPHKIPSLFGFSRTSVYLLMSPETIQRNPTSVVLRATSIHGPLALEIPVEVLSAPAETIHQLAAKKAVQDLEEGRGWIFDAKDQAGVLVKQRYPSSFNDLVQTEAVRLGEKFQVAGKWCSFVAVSANDAEIAANSTKESSGDSFDFGFVDDLLAVNSQNSESGAHRSLTASGKMTQAGYSIPLLQALMQVPGPMPQPTTIPQARPGSSPFLNNGPSSGTSLSLSATPCGSQSPFGQRGPGITLFGSPSSHSGRALCGGFARAAQPEYQSAFGQSNHTGGSSFGVTPQAALFLSPRQQMQVQQAGMPLTGDVHQSSSVTPQGSQNVFGQSGQGTSSLFRRDSSQSSDRASSGGFGSAAPPGNQVPIGLEIHLGGSSFGAQAASFGQGPATHQETYGYPVGCPQSHQAERRSNYNPMSGQPIADISWSSFSSVLPERDSNRLRNRKTVRRTSHSAVINAASHSIPRGRHVDLASLSVEHIVRGVPFSSIQATAEVDWTTKWESKSATEKVLGLISLQDFEGCWHEDDEEIPAILGFEIPTMPAASANGRIWMTLLVVCFLEVKNGDDEGTWGLVVEKARDWLAGNVMTGLEDLEKQAKSFVMGRRMGVYGGFH